MREEWYDVIFYVESSLQQQIVEYLLNNHFFNKKVLVIAPLKNKPIDVKTRFTYINSQYDLHGYKKVLPTCLKLLSHRPPRYKCNLFVASVLTGLNSLLWEAQVSYDQLGMLDDGTGTLYNLYFDRVFENKRVKRIFKIYNIYCAIINHYKILDSKVLRKKVKKYYSVYLNSFENLEVVHIPLFKASKTYKVIDESCFVGQPFVELGYLSQNEYREILIKIAKKVKQPLIYYPHPKEDVSKLNTLQFIKVRNVNCSIEKHLAELVPKNLISISSSALINISLRYGNQYSSYVPVNMSKYPDICNYYKLMDQVGIKRLII